MREIFLKKANRKSAAPVKILKSLRVIRKTKIRRVSKIIMPKKNLRIFKFLTI